MKRLPAPDIRDIEGLDTDFAVKRIREDLPPHWLLSELLFHTVMLCMDGYKKLTARLLVDIALSVPDGGDLKASLEEDTPFNRVHEISYYQNEDILHAFLENASEEEKIAWERMTVEDADHYMQRRDEALPHYKVLLDGAHFFFHDYRHLPDDLRAVIDLAFSGFLRDAVTGSDFAALCADKALDVSALTCAQRMEVPLDHEALYHALLVKLGHA